MKEELLKQLKKELENEKLKNENHNKKVKRIKELLKEPSVKEYIKLTNIVDQNLKNIKLTDEEIISSFYSKYLHKIKKEETNGIYVYLGTYENNNEVDIVHGSNDFRVDYNSSNADYRIYKNIESPYGEIIPIRLCEEFEKNNIIIYPKTYFKEQEYYKIQKDFFVKAVKTNQETAKKMILKKYNNSNKN